jgi:glutamate/tyrosine decarboxylase-like PLP-dependent enzyme
VVHIGGMPTNPRDALRAWFLGPRGENADLMERLLTESFRDHVFWRRNFRPEDGITIREVDRRQEGYEDANATLTQELMALLADLKRDVPFFSGRYQGHMVCEPTIASQVGYFAAMLYNPNNVTRESGPVTTRLEFEVTDQLARMIGFDPADTWGHLTSGGTVANFEALWIARSLFYLPVAAAMAARAGAPDVAVQLVDGSSAPLSSLGLYELLNLRGPSALDAWDTLRAAVPRTGWPDVIDRHTLAHAGYQEYTRRLAAHWGDPLPDSVVLVAATAHYSWEKIVRALGIGAQQLEFVPVDRHCRIDPDALWERIEHLHARRAPILACISVCGSTEEGAVDRLDQVLEVRARAEEQLGVTFHLHADACYGGYTAAVTRRADGTHREPAEIRASTGINWPSDDWVRSIVSLGWFDSVTIDPHKLGYAPYPAGAMLLRDRRARDLVSVAPPYLAPAAGAPDASFMGQFILEGSKPGAAAAAVWLGQKVLPLDERGYGYLIERTVIGAYRLYDAIEGADLSPFTVVMLPRPDLNIVCFVVSHPSIDGLAALNRFNEGVYRLMSLGDSGQMPDYVITRTRLCHPNYDGAVPTLLTSLGLASADEWRQCREGLVVLRSTVMDPFLAGDAGGTDHVAGYVAALQRACVTAWEAVTQAA